MKAKTYTVKQIADKAGVTEQTVYRWIREGLKTVKPVEHSGNRGRPHVFGLKLQDVRQFADL